jgi:hypothetical protein
MDQDEDIGEGVPDDGDDDQTTDPAEVPDDEKP